MSVTGLVDSVGRDLRQRRGLALSAVGLGVGLVAALASYLPARRASAIDPIETLNAE